jgi:hypothetical protein
MRAELGILFLALAALTAQADQRTRPCYTDVAGEEALQRAKARYQEILRKRDEQQVVETLANPIRGTRSLMLDRPHPEQWYIEGVPKKVRSLETSRRIFRHYTDTKENLRAIVKAGALTSGFVPYVEVDPGMRSRTYTDLTGIFLTHEDATSTSVGLERADYYVDLKLDSRVPVLEITDEIFLIPLPSRSREWVIQSVRRIENAEEEASPAEMENYRRYRENLRTDRFIIPIEVVASGRIS